MLWWASHHRDHHLNSDREADLHSPVHEGFWWSHLGWILSDEYDAYDPRRIADFAKFPELRWLDRFHLVPAVVYAVAVFLIGGWGAFVWGFVVSTVVLYHGTFLINSLAHIWGSRRFATPDESRNNFFLALVTLGEGWHNNHHHFMSSVRQGIRWWEVDVTLLRAPLPRGSASRKSCASSANSVLPAPELIPAQRVPERRQENERDRSLVAVGSVRNPIGLEIRIVARDAARCMPGRRFFSRSAIASRSERTPDRAGS